MATLTLRNLPDDLVARLKERAKRHRRAMSATADGVPRGKWIDR